MRQLLTVLGQVFRKSVVVLALMSVLSVSGLCFLSAQPSYAAPSSSFSAPAQKTNDAKVEQREQAYEEAIETANEPNGLEKEYEKNLATYEEEHPGNPFAGAVEGAKQLIDQATGQK